MNIDITPLERALAQLEESLQLLDAKVWGDNNASRRNHERGAVQAFEFTYGVAVNLLKRQMEQIRPDSGEFGAMRFEDFLRASAAAGLIPSLENFFDYWEKRNLTSHNYNEEVSRQLLAILNPFAEDMRFLLKQLQDRNR